MVLAVLSISLQSQQSLTFDGQTFRYGSLTYEVAPKPTEKNEKVVYRKDDAFVVWDARGLTIRKGKQKFTTRFEDACLSPKLWTVEEIEATKEKIAQGLAKKEATELVASLRLGDEVVFVPRWADSSGVPWADVAFRANLADESVKPILIGKWPGRLVKTNSERATLSFAGSEIIGLTRFANNKWGIVRTNLLDGMSSTIEVGSGLLGAVQVNRRLALVTEQVNGKVKRLVRVDLFESKRRDLLESSGTLSVVVVDGRAFCVNQTDRRKTLHDLQTGQVLEVPMNATVVSALGGLLAHSTSKASLFDAVTLDTIGVWSKVAPKPADRSERSRSQPKRPGRPSSRRDQ